jgi:DNA-binding transcriptional LysR family regulator
MNQLLAMRAFRSIVEARGFSAAAERMDTTHSTVSRLLQQLEGELGVRLINRNTRRFSLTESGERYYAACVDILDRVDLASQAMVGDPGPAGLLRISALMVVGTLELASWLPAFNKRYPDIQIELCCDDRFVDLVAERFDVALRICGPLHDTSLVARQLTVSDVILVASPGYILRHGLVRGATELAEHSLLTTVSGGSAPWQLKPERGAVVSINPAGFFRADSMTSLHCAALAGAGVAAFTRSTVQADLESGRLVRMLPGYTLGSRHYYLLYPHAQHLAPKVRAFVDFMIEHYLSA